MLYLNDEQMEQAKPDMPAKEIRAIRKPVLVAPAQEESESIDALEFSVRVRNVLKMAGIDTVNQLLSTPDDELIKIRHLSKRCLDEIHSKLDERKQEESPVEEKPNVLHFTADDKSIDNAYGAMIAELIGNYLDNAYKSPDRECEASVFGQTYKILKRPEVTVFYMDDGRTFFDVENARLEREYQWRQKNKPKPDIPEKERMDMIEKEIGKATGELQERIDLYEKHYQGTVPEYYDALKLAVKALRKQLPVSARKEWGKSIGDHSYYRYVCPECKKILRPSTRGKYCPYCGQRIDWEEE